MTTNKEEGELAYVATEMGGLTIRQLETSTIVRDEAQKIQILTIGQENNKSTKTILFIGQTGSGKTTVLNAMINSLMGVQFEDNFRYSVKDEIGEQEKKITDSRTEFVTGYLIYDNPRMTYDCNFLLIDTPGLLDIKGEQHHKEIIKRLEFIVREDNFNVNELHCLAFVINGTINRTYKYVNDIITDFENLFGRETINVTNVIATHTLEGSSVQNVVTDMKLSYIKCYNFENEYIFCKNQDNTRLAKCAALTWEEVMEQYQNFFKRVVAVSPVSLLMTKELIIEKNELKRTIANLRNHIKCKINRMLDYENRNELYEEHQRNMESNKEFQYEETVIEKRKIPIENLNAHAHNCTVCNKTCISSCTKGSFGHLFQSSTCSSCKCPWEKHKLEQSSIVSEHKKRVVFREEMANRFKEATSKTKDLEEEKKRLEEQIKEASIEVVMLTRKVEEHIRRIDRMTRIAEPLTFTEYLDGVLNDVKKEITPKLRTDTDKAFVNQIIDEIRNNPKVLRLM
ncbi:uncharacterized protein LOC119582773 [Penaeus monodon]|uniref:uncharacterized protein LOC119582773 n=1 Tax=Penaeus monodon TaxID=6687 RepID=UPI0018A7B41A|nr:uncharacterized protein LOC119582773 [Penaeus monodon]